MEVDQLLPCTHSLLLALAARLPLHTRACTCTHTTHTHTHTCTRTRTHTNAHAATPPPCACSWTCCAATPRWQPWSSSSSSSRQRSRRRRRRARGLMRRRARGLQRGCCTWVVLHTLMRMRGPHAHMQWWWVAVVQWLQPGAGDLVRPRLLMWMRMRAWVAGSSGLPAATRPPPCSGTFVPYHSTRGWWPRLSPWSRWARACWRRRGAWGAAPPFLASRAICCTKRAGGGLGAGGQGRAGAGAA